MEVIAGESVIGVDEVGSGATDLDVSKVLGKLVRASIADVLVGSAI
jgi:hypothetical protein